MNAFDQIIARIERLRTEYLDQKLMLETSSPGEPSVTRAFLSKQAAITAADLGMLRDYVESLRNEAEEAPVKPWYDANPGEVWVITFENEKLYALVDEDCDFVISDETAGRSWVSMRHPAITAGHRVLEAIK